MPNTDSPHWQEVSPSNEPLLYSKPTPDLNEVAAKAPETLPENSDERMLRERAEWFYRNSLPFSGLSGYSAGWLAAKAHYEQR